MNELIYKDESFRIIGCCIEVHKILGKGFLEVVYKDALEYEFKENDIPYYREKEFPIPYKKTILEHKFFADFTVFDKIILEIKHKDSIIDDHIAQTLNYQKISNYKLGIIVNFGELSLKYKRLVL